MRFPNNDIFDSFHTQEKDDGSAPVPFPYQRMSFKVRSKVSEILMQNNHDTKKIR